jgi:hypothetical protein
MFPKDINNLHVLVKDCLIGETPAMDNTEGRKLIAKSCYGRFSNMKIKDAARIACLIETEGSIIVFHKDERNTNQNGIQIYIDISNSDLSIINWAKSILEKELNCDVNINKNTSRYNTRECWKLRISNISNIHKLLNITRGYMIGIKKNIADWVVSFLDFRESLLNENGNLKREHSLRYKKAYNELVKKVEKLKENYNGFLPVTTVHSPDLNGQKIQSGLVSDDERLAEMTSPLEKA